MPVVGVGAAAADHGADWTVPDLAAVDITASRPEFVITLHQVTS
jgi:hypothetical protein